MQNKTYCSNYSILINITINSNIYKLTLPAFAFITVMKYCVIIIMLHILELLSMKKTWVNALVCCAVGHYYLTEGIFQGYYNNIV